MGVDNSRTPKPRFRTTAPRSPITVASATNSRVYIVWNLMYIHVGFSIELTDKTILHVVKPSDVDRESASEATHDPARLWLAH